MTANLLKHQLVQYTQEQCGLWNIPVEHGVPLAHIFDVESFRWYDDYVDLPVNPVTGMPLLFVPRRMVRLLPWINFDDYARNELRAFLRPLQSRRLDQLPGTSRTRPKVVGKATAVEVTRHEMGVLDEYVRRKEAEANLVEPTDDLALGAPAAPMADTFMAQLRAIPPGHAGAGTYQRTILGILNHLFEPELTDGRLEEPTVHGTERRDIMFVNEANQSFWAYIRQQYSGLFVMFETKNVCEVDNTHINQVATYLGDRIGRFGVILTRNPVQPAQMLKTYSVFNNESPRKVILILHDGDIEAMLQLKDRGERATGYVQDRYRSFMTSLQ